jgi:hypothetical protein
MLSYESVPFIGSCDQQVGSTKHPRIIVADDHTFSARSHEIKTLLRVPSKAPLPVESRVSVADALEGGLPWSETLSYVFAQILGGVSGTVLANLMFSLPYVSLSHHGRSGHAQFLSEFVATFGLLSVIWGCSRSRAIVTPFAVGSYITAAYWFTSSTSFANPAVTIARCLSDSFAGIRPIDVPWFVTAQVLGGIAATMVFRWLVPNLQVRAKEVLVAHDLEQNR